MVNVSYFDKSFTSPEGDTRLSIKVRSYPDLDSSVVEVIKKNLSYTIALPYIDPSNKNQIFNLHYHNDDYDVLFIVPKIGGYEIITLDVNDISYSVSRFLNIRNIMILSAHRHLYSTDGKYISRVYVSGEFGENKNIKYCVFSTIGYKSILSDLFKSGNYIVQNFGTIGNIPNRIDIDTSIVDDPVRTASIKNKMNIIGCRVFSIMDRPEMLNLSVIVNNEQSNCYHKYRMSVYDNDQEIMHFLVDDITLDQVNNIRAFVVPNGDRYLIFINNNANMVIVNVERKTICRYMIYTKRGAAYRYNDSIFITGMDFDTENSKINIKTRLHLSEDVLFNEEDCDLDICIVLKVGKTEIYFDKFADIPIKDKIDNINVLCSETSDIDVFTTGELISQNNTPLYRECVSKRNNEESIHEIIDRIKNIDTSILDDSSITKINRARINSIIDKIEDEFRILDEIIGKYTKHTED